MINVFRQTGDTAASLRRHFEKTDSKNDYGDRLAADFLLLLSELRFSEAFNNLPDSYFVGPAKRPEAAWTLSW
jgi:hypothetical protein